MSDDPSTRDTCHEMTPGLQEGLPSQHTGGLESSVKMLAFLSVALHPLEDSESHFRGFSGYTNYMALNTPPLSCV